MEDLSRPPDRERYLKELSTALAPHRFELVSPYTLRQIYSQVEVVVGPQGIDITFGGRPEGRRVLTVGYLEQPEAALDAVAFAARALHHACMITL